MCHAAKINQVVLNLLANAIDACADGGCVTVRTSCADGDVTIDVADTGKGIAADIRPRIFDPFFTTKPIGKGTGLGLSISYGIAQETGGRSSWSRPSGRERASRSGCRSLAAAAKRLRVVVATSTSRRVPETRGARSILGLDQARAAVDAEHRLSPARGSVLGLFAGCDAELRVQQRPAGDAVTHRRVRPQVVHVVAVDGPRTPERPDAHGRGAPRTGS